jgi:hypothetical protein
VVRLKPQGAIDYATYLGGSSQAWSDGIAVDALGAAFIIGAANSAKFPVTPGAYLAASGIPNFSASSFLARLSPDGSALIYSTFTDAQGDHDAAVAVDSADNAVVLLSNAAGTGSGVLRFNPQGTVRLFSKSLPASDPAGLALDAAGNAYLASFTGANYPVKNSLAACDSNGSSALTVLDGNGNVLQSTYIPGSSGYTNTTPAVGLGVDSTVYVVGSPTASSTPTQQLAGSQPGLGLLFLTSFSQDAIAQVVQLACIGNAASYDSTGIAGGEMVSLFGQGLGPANGAQPQVDAHTGFPKQLDGVAVTFDGTPGPLLYAQDGQVKCDRAVVAPDRPDGPGLRCLQQRSDQLSRADGGGGGPRCVHGGRLLCGGPESGWKLQLGLQSRPGGFHCDGLRDWTRGDQPAAARWGNRRRPIAGQRFAGRDVLVSRTHPYRAYPNVPRHKLCRPGAGVLKRFRDF